MKKTERLSILAFAFLFIQPVFAQHSEKAFGVEAKAVQGPISAAVILQADSALNAALQDLYLVISGPAGQKRDWAKFRSMFAPNAQMGIAYRNKQGQADYKLLTPEEYITTSGKYLEENGFFEKAIHNQIEKFGDLVQVWSTYEARQKETDAKPLMRGINSIQLVRMGTQYKIASLIWQQETQQFALPLNYLPVK